MTEDYKKTLLDYLTGVLTQTSPTTDEIFEEETNINRNLWSSFLPNHWDNFRFEGMVAPNETTSSLGVLYGGYIDNNVVNGIIILFDNDFVPIKAIYKYSSGTPLRYIQYMKQAEDGTFYFVDDTAFTYNQNQQVVTSQKRFVMVNNFTVQNTLTNDYEVALRRSFIFSGNYVNFYCKNMFKNPNSSHYIFFGAAADTNVASYDYRYLKIIGLKVNVGEANEWTLYANAQSRIFGSAFALFDENDNVMFRCLNCSSLNSSTSIDCTSKTYTGTVQTNSIATFNFNPYVDEFYFKKQSVFLSMNEVYFVQNNQHWGTSGTPNAKYIGLYKYNFTNSTLTTIFEKSLGSYVYCNLEAMYIDRCNTDIYVQYANNVDSSGSEPVADYYFQRLVNDIWQPILIAEQKYFRYNQRTIFIKNNFNLLQIYLYATNPRGQSWFQYLIKENYNSLNYNGESYIDYNSLKAKQGTIYSNNSLVFARNLYNQTIYNNMVNSTVVVPNSYLNDILLNQNNLLSETNLSMVEQNQTYTKNIYETLYLNFINTYKVINQDTNTLYPYAGAYVAENITTGTQTTYDNGYVGKIKINTNSTPRYLTLTWENVSDTIRKATATIYVSQEIISIDFVSDDETMIYNSIDASELEVGKTYTLTQYLTIE